MATASGAVEVTVPDLLNQDVLERAEYFESFPQTALRVSAREYLPPAVCYHCYEALRFRRLESPALFTCRGRCFRNEASTAPGRLREFTMREVVFLGPTTWVIEQRRAWMARVEVFAASLDIWTQMEVATDPFFVAGESRGKKLLQQVKELKYELRADLGKAPPQAIASFNLHEAFFGQRFGITLADGVLASSGCVAFGLERWCLAALRQAGRGAATAVAGKDSK